MKTRADTKSEKAEAIENSKGGEVNAVTEVKEESAAAPVSAPTEEKVAVEKADGDNKTTSAGTDADKCKTDVPKTETSEPKTEDRIMDGTARKVVVHNVLKFLRPNEAKQLVASWLEGKEHLGIVIEKFKKPPMDNWIRVVLEKESMVEPFLNVINTGVRRTRTVGRGPWSIGRARDSMPRRRIITNTTIEMAGEAGRGRVATETTVMDLPKSAAMVVISSLPKRS